MNRNKIRRKYNMLNMIASDGWDCGSLLFYLFTFLQNYFKRVLF